MADCLDKALDWTREPLGTIYQGTDAPTEKTASEGLLRRFPLSFDHAYPQPFRCRLCLRIGA